MKSKAPALIPSTANSMLPQAVISITGTFGAKIFICRSSVNPSSPVVKREKFMSSNTSSGSRERTISIAAAGPSATTGS